MRDAAKPRDCDQRGPCRHMRSPPRLVEENVAVHGEDRESGWLFVTELSHSEVSGDSARNQFLALPEIV